MEANREHLAYGPAAVLHAVIDEVVDGYVAIDAEIATDLEQLEESVFAGEVDVAVVERTAGPRPTPLRAGATAARPAASTCSSARCSRCAGR